VQRDGGDQVVRFRSSALKYFRRGDEYTFDMAMMRIWAYSSSGRNGGIYDKDILVVNSLFKICMYCPN